MCDGRSRASLEEALLFDRLFRMHAETVLRYCVRRTRDPTIAEDIRSAVFVEAWRRRGDVDFETREALPWLYGVAANLLRNHARATRRREAAFGRMELPRPTDDFADDLAERLDTAQRAREAIRTVQYLPPGERDVLVLCVLRGMSYAAAARSLDLPVGTVRSRLARARSRLRERSAAG